MKHKKERSRLLPSFAPLLWNYTGKNDVVYRPKDIAERKVVLEKEHLSHKQQALQWISSLGWGSFFLRAFPALLIQITKAKLISTWAAPRLLLRVLPFPPLLTSSRKFLPGNKQSVQLHLKLSSTLIPCPKLYTLIIFLDYFLLYYLILSTVTSMWPPWAATGLMEIKVVPSRRFQAVCFCFLWSH